MRVLRSTTLAVQLNFAPSALNKIHFFSTAMVTHGKETVGARKVISQEWTNIVFDIELGMVSYMPESFVLDVTWMTCPILAVPHDLYVGAALAG